MPSMPLRRKKWTEEEEETLINKYGELLQSGFLSKMKSRERKFEPIASHVNALFHAQNPGVYPWQWTWKDASTKVQNMRHQYLGVKQKIRRVVSSIDAGELEHFDWEDGLSHWSNFLKYKDVFGDQDLDVNDFLSPSIPHPNPNPSSHGDVSPSARILPSRRPPFRPQALPKDLILMSGGAAGMVGENGSLLLGSSKDANLEIGDRVDHVVLDGETGDIGTSLGFDYENGNVAIKDAGEDYDDEEEDNMEYCRQNNKRLRATIGAESSVSESRILAFIASQFVELREREARREERELKREREREKKDFLMESTRKQEWERERQEVEQLRKREAEREQETKRDMLEQQRREERERAREEKMEREKMEWREKMETQALQHQAAMMQIQLQIAQSQQSSIAMLAGVVLQIASQQGNDLSGQGSAISPFVSQLLQNLQAPGNGMVHCGIRRGAGESGDSQFDVDG